MSSPANEDGTHKYEPVPCTMIPPEENVTSQNSALPWNTQPIPSGPHVYSVPPVVTTAVPQNTLSPAMYEIFIKEKTRELSIVLIVTAIVHFILGFGTLFTDVHYIFFSGIPFWGPVCYLVAGTLTMTIRKSPSICMVRASLALNILGAIISGTGIIMACLDIAAPYTCTVHRGNIVICPQPQIIDVIVLLFVLITYLLSFCVATSIAAFGCKTLNYVPTVPQIFLLQNGVLVPAPTSAFPTTPVVFTQSPPSCTVLVEENNQHQL